MGENFYRDNPDIKFVLDHMDLSDVVELYEPGFKEAAEYPHAPESVEDALDSYHRVLDVLGELAAEFIAPRATDVDREGAQYNGGDVQYPKGIREDLDALTKAELMGFTLPRRYGGLNLPRVLYVAAIEIVSRADAALMTIFGLQDIAETIHDFADDEIKDEYLPKFASGEITGAMVLTEPDAGSDLQAVQLKATEDPDNVGLWRLNGVKRFITNGCGDVLLVLARSEPGTKDGRGLSMLLCEKGDNILIRRIEDKLGIHGSPTCEMQFNNVPAKLIGKRRRGLTKYVMSLMNGARIGIAAQSLGIAEAAYAEALPYAKEREQFGKKIIDIPPVTDMLADMKVTIEAGRALLYDTCRYVDYEAMLERLMESGEAPEDAKSRLAEARKLAAVLTPMSKYYLTEAANSVAYDSLQIHGGSGYMRDYDIERIYRDARITNIYEGTTQLQAVAIQAGLLGGNLNNRLGELAGRSYDGELKDLQDKVIEAQKNLLEAIETARSSEVGGYADLAGDQLSQLVCDVYAAHLLIAQAQHAEHFKGSEHLKSQAKHSERKLVIARRFIARMKTAFDADLPTMETLRTIIG
jgi:alkylation response protein AidB-like acyl-CoA dehydrogenase